MIKKIIIAIIFLFLAANCQAEDMVMNPYTSQLDLVYDEATEIYTSVFTFNNNDVSIEWALNYLKDNIGGGAGGDDVYVDGGDVTDPDFVSTGDIDFVDTSNTITANIRDGYVDPIHLANDDFGAFSCNAGSCTIEANAVGDSQIDETTYGATVTWLDDASDATSLWTWALSGATDPAITFGDNLVNISTGILQAASQPVVTDNNSCTDIEGTGLSITTGVLNWAATAFELTDFPADPDADQYLMWDDDPGEFVFSTLAGGGDLLADGSVPLTADWDAGDGSYDITAVEFKGDLKGTADTSTMATLLIITDNENTAETNAVIFTAGGDLDGGVLGLESDGDFNYNPSTGQVAATSFTGAFSSAFTGTLTGDVIGNVGCIDGTEILDDTIDSEDYAAGSIDAEHLAADIIDETKIADNGIDSEHYNDDSIDAEHINTITCGRSTTWDVANDEIDADAETYTDIKCILIETPADADDLLFFRNDIAVTVTSIDCICEDATSAVVVISECDSAGDNCGSANSRLEESITADVDGQADDGTIGNAGIAAGDWLRAQVGTVTGTPGHVTCCITYQYDD